MISSATLAEGRADAAPPSIASAIPPVLIVGNHLSGWGFSRAMDEELADRLAARGVTVTTTSTVRRPVPRLLDMLRTVWRERERYAVAHVAVFSGSAFVWAEAVCWLLRRLGTPYVLTLRGGNLPSFARRWPGRVRRLLRSAAAVTVPSGFLRDQLCPLRSDLRLLPNAVDVGGAPFRLRASLEPRLVWLRAFHELYNPSLAPRVLAALADRWPHATLTMIGADKGDGSLQRAMSVAESLGAADRARFVGAVAKREVPSRLSEGDIFLNTTNADNTPVSVIEAMACGLCVVSTNVGGLPHLLEDGHDALLVPPDDPQAMADAVRRILGDSHLAARLSRNARAKAESMDWETVLPQWELLLTHVARGAGA
jgi:glycosyltransferase involved in cell wall biosynthesis